MRDEKTGRFITTTDTTQYKRVQFNNKPMQAHHREFCIAMNIPKIPKGFVVHHIDKDTRNNDINNLALMSITAHNRIHAHKAWNKGIKAENNPEWKKTIVKAHKNRKKRFLEKWEETYKLREQGLTFIEIGKILGKSRNTVSNQYYQYKNYVKQ